jgi:hypothetical protein
MAYRQKFESDARGWRVAHAAFWLDGALLDLTAEVLGGRSGSSEGSGSSGSSDPHYLFNELRVDQKTVRSGRAALFAITTSRDSSQYNMSKSTHPLVFSTLPALMFLKPRVLRFHLSRSFCSLCSCGLPWRAIGRRRAAIRCWSWATTGVHRGL